VGFVPLFFYYFMFKNIENEISEYLAQKGFYLIDFLERGEKKNIILEIYIDCKENLDLDKIATISKDLNELVDKSEIFKSILKVVVSSPGADKPFKYIWQVAKYINKNIEYILNGEKRKAKLLDVNIENNTLLLKEKIDKKDCEIERDYGMLEDVKIKLPF